MQCNRECSIYYFSVAGSPTNMCKAGCGLQAQGNTNYCKCSCANIINTRDELAACYMGCKFGSMLLMSPSLEPDTGGVVTTVRSTTSASSTASATTTFSSTPSGASSQPVVASNEYASAATTTNPSCQDQNSAATEYVSSLLGLDLNCSQVAALGGCAPNANFPLLSALCQFSCQSCNTLPVSTGPLVTTSGIGGGDSSQPSTSAVPATTSTATTTDRPVVKTVKKDSWDLQLSAILGAVIGVLILILLITIVAIRRRRVVTYVVDSSDEEPCSASPEPAAFTTARLTSHKKLGELHEDLSEPSMMLSTMALPVSMSGPVILQHQDWRPSTDAVYLDESRRPPGGLRGLQDDDDFESLALGEDSVNERARESMF